MRNKLDFQEKQHTIINYLQLFNNLLTIFFRLKIRHFLIFKSFLQCFITSQEILGSCLKLKYEMLNTEKIVEKHISYSIFCIIFNNISTSQQYFLATVMFCQIIAFNLHFYIHVFTFYITSLFGTSIIISSFFIEPRRIPGASELFSYSCERTRTFFIN